MGSNKNVLISPYVFSVLRISPYGNERILTHTTVTARLVHRKINTTELGNEFEKWYDLMRGNEHVLETRGLVLIM